MFRLWAMASVSAAAHADLAAGAEHVAYLTGAAVENFAGLEANAGAGFADGHSDGVTGGIDARSARCAFGKRFALHPYGRRTTRALHVAVQAGRGGGDHRGGRPVGHAGSAPFVQRRALFGREEKTAELLSSGL